MKIQRVQVTIEPYWMDDNCVTLRVKVDPYPGQIATYERTVRPDDIAPMLDIIMDDAKERLRELLQEQKNE